MNTIDNSLPSHQGIVQGADHDLPPRLFSFLPHLTQAHHPSTSIRTSYICTPSMLKNKPFQGPTDQLPHGPAEILARLCGADASTASVPCISVGSALWSLSSVCLTGPSRIHPHLKPPFLLEKAGKTWLDRTKGFSCFHFYIIQNSGHTTYLPALAFQCLFGTSEFTVILHGWLGCYLASGHPWLLQQKLPPNKRHEYEVGVCPSIIRRWYLPFATVPHRGIQGPITRTYSIIAQNLDRPSSGFGVHS